MEQWKTIETHPNYEISNLGRVRNKITNTFKSVNPNKDGYMKTTLYPGSKMYFIHRLVAYYFLENPENKPIVNHIDSCRTNNFVDNLEWATHAENAQHMVKQGNNPNYNGCNNPTSKFTEEDILKIRNDDRPVSQQAKDWEVSETVITNIKNGTRYKNVGGPIREKGYKGNQRKGTNINTNKISEELAKEIKYAKARTHKEVAEKYQISYYIVSKIRANITWKHI